MTELVGPISGYVPLATAQDFQDVFAAVSRSWAGPQLDRLLVRASRAVESRCQRKFSPFTLTESQRAGGSDVDEYGAQDSGMADLFGALGRDRARAYGANRLVRHVWLREYAPLHPELWQYADVSVVLARTYGDTQTIPGSSLEGPEPDTGHLRFRLGTFNPEGTTVRITYTGGYSPVPEDLMTATVFLAAKTAILQAEPMMRSGLDMDELEKEITNLLAPYARA